MKFKTIMYGIRNDEIAGSLCYCVYRTQAAYAGEVIPELGPDALLARREKFVIVPVGSDRHNIAVVYDIGQ